MALNFRIESILCCLTSREDVFSGTDPEPYITEVTLVYEDKLSPLRSEAGQYSRRGGRAVLLARRPAAKRMLSCYLSLHIYLSLYLSICLYVCLFIYLCLSFYLSVYGKALRVWDATRGGCGKRGRRVRPARRPAAKRMLSV